MDAGEIDLALTQNDSAFHAVMTDDVLGHKGVNIAGLVALYSELLHIVVRRDSGITAVEDLRGMTINVGGGFGALSSKTLLSGYDIYDSDFGVSTLAADAAVQEASVGTIDAIMQWTSVPATYFEEPLRGGAFTLVSIDPDLVAGLQMNAPFLRPATIPPRAYPLQVEEVPTVAVTALLVASARLPNDLVEQILDVMFTNVLALIAKHPRAADISLQTAFGRENGMTIPLHPGAAAFREAHAAEINGR